MQEPTSEPIHEEHMDEEPMDDVAVEPEVVVDDEPEVVEVEPEVAVPVEVEVAVPEPEKVVIDAPMITETKVKESPPKTIKPKVVAPKPKVEKPKPKKTVIVKEKKQAIPDPELIKKLHDVDRSKLKKKRIQGYDVIVDDCYIHQRCWYSTQRNTKELCSCQVWCHEIFSISYVQEKR